MPLIANELVVETVPCLRRLIPGDVVAVAVFVLPAVVFPEMLRQSVVSPAADPESTRMPARAAVVVAGAATVLFWIFWLSVQLEFRAIAKIPGPSVRLTLLPLIVEVSVPVSAVVVSESESHPIPMPDDATALFATIRLLFAMDVTVLSPNSESSITTPSKAFPPWTTKPAPEGKLLMTLLSRFAFVTFATSEADPSATSRTADPSELATDVELVNVFPVTFGFDVLSLKLMFESSAAPPVPELLMVPFANVKPDTCVPLMPLPLVFWMFMFVSEGLSVLVSAIP